MYMTANWIGVIDPATGEEVPGGDVRLDTIKKFDFSPKTDLSGNSLPVNQYVADVVTEDEIPFTSASVRLYDDMDQLWCAWPVSKAIRISKNLVRVTGTSWLYWLEYRELDEEMYESKSASEAISDCIGSRYSIYFSVASAIGSKTLNGYVPKQNARERLTWLLFVLGAYISDVFGDTAQIKAVDNTSTEIPIDRTFMRPSVDTGNWITGVKVTTYAFTEGTEEEWSEDSNSYMYPIPWIAEEQTFEISNPDAPLDAAPNVIELDSIYLINPTNMTDVITHAAQYWFNPVQAQVDCINNRQYKPGDMVNAHTATDAMISGFVQQASFKFGKQARSTLTLTGTRALPSAVLTINYICNGTRIKRIKYRLPVGVEFRIKNNYLDITKNGHRRIYRPETEYAEGTMVAGGVTVNVQCEIALDLYKGVLTILIVDEITEESSSTSEGNITIGVIK